MYGTGGEERVTRSTGPLARVTQGTGQDRTGDVHHWTAPKRDARNSWGRTRDVRHPARLDG